MPRLVQGFRERKKKHHLTVGLATCAFFCFSSHGQEGRGSFFKGRFRQKHSADCREPVRGWFRLNNLCFITDGLIGALQTLFRTFRKACAHRFCESNYRLSHISYRLSSFLKRILYRGYWGPTHQYPTFQMQFLVFPAETYSQSICLVLKQFF